MKKLFLNISQNSEENTCDRVSFLINLQAACNFIKKETLAQVFSCEFCKISKKTFLTEWLLLDNRLKINHSLLAKRLSLGKQ